MSLRRRILVLTVAVAGLVLVAFAVPLVVLLQQAARESALEKATDVAHGVADYASTSTVTTASLRAYVGRVNARGDDAPPVRVELADGTRLGAALSGIGPHHGSRRSDPDQDGDRDNGPDGRGDPDHDAARFASTSAAAVQDVRGGRLVTITVAGQSGPTDVSAFAASSRVQAIVLQRLVVLVGIGVAVMLLALLAAELVTRRLVRDLDATAQTADELRAGDLASRAPEDGPAEVRRVAVALNRLAGRIDELLLLERETVADLSHRLRTPLTAVRLDVEALPVGEGRRELEDHLDLLERTLTSVIHAARRPEREGVLPQCDAALLVRERVEFWGPLVEEQGRAVTVEVDDGPLDVRCAPSELTAALDALIENVVAHTPDLTAWRMTAHRADDRVVLEVGDQGPGIPAGARDRGRSDRGSSGLGLDIARSCAESSGGRLVIAREGGWTVVRLVLGTP